MAVKITILYDNTAPVKAGLSADWGFSALVEVDQGKTILFDTGANGEILLNNMKVLGILPTTIDAVFISHAHHDHVGGLASFLEENNDVTIWLPPSFHGRLDVKERVIVSKPMALVSGIYSTGELEGIEQSMAVETAHGLMVVVGCSHPNMKTILKTASRFGEPYSIVGGLHGTHPKWLAGLSLIVATHCTQFKSEIKQLYPDAYREGGVGKVIEIP